MQSFVVFDTEEIDARHFPPRHAYLVGPDETPVQGEIVFREGVVDATKFVQATVGLCVQMAVRLPSSNGGEGQGADLGVLCVQTCLLPDRTQPYLLTIELARRQIMMVLNKMEDWGLFDLSAQTPSFEQFERARQMFTRALVAQKGDGHEPTREGYCAKADALAGDALALSLSAGEGLTLINAERQLKQRLSGAGYEAAVAHLARLTPERPPASRSWCPARALRAQRGARDRVRGLAGAVHRGAAEGRAGHVRLCDDAHAMDRHGTDGGRYNFGATDRWIEWAIRTAKLPVVGGPLVDFRPQCAPDWLFIWENDYETLRDLVYEHVQAVVTRYRRTVSRWTVASGLHVNTNFKISFEQIIDLTKMCVQIVRRLHPAAKVVLEVAQPWGEYHALNRRSIPPFVYAEAVVQVGAASLASHVDAIGLRMQMGNAEPGNATRDLMAFSAALDRYANLEKPIAITALGAPSSMITPKPYRPRAGAEPTDPYEPGFWRQPWSEAQQAEWLAQVMTIAASKPYVQSICWQELSDGPGGLGPEMPTGGLMHAGGVAKPSLVRLAQVRKAIKEGRWPLNPAS